MEQGYLWEYKHREKLHQIKNEKTPRNLHAGRLYGGPEKGRAPTDPRVGGAMPAGGNTLVSEVLYPMDKGRRVEHQVIP
jgi:hypothetical protein